MSTTPHDPLVLLQVVRISNGKYMLRIHVSILLKTTKSFNVILDRRTDSSSISVILNLFLNNVHNQQCINFSGVTLKEGKTIFESSAFKDSSKVEVEVNIDPNELVAPSLPIFPKDHLTSFALVCLTCEAVIADAHPEYKVEFKDGDEPEDAVGENQVITEGGPLKPPIVIEIPLKRIVIDRGSLIVCREYINKETIIVRENCELYCASCKNIVGRKLVNEKYEFEPLLADFKGRKIMSMFASETHYLICRILNNEPHTYISICDYDGTAHILTGLQSIQKVAVVKTVNDRNTKSYLALANIFSMQTDVVDKGFGPKVYFPTIIRQRLQALFYKGHTIHKAWNIDIGLWQFCIIPIA